jgi:hypothetical protein
MEAQVTKTTPTATSAEPAPTRAALAKLAPRRRHYISLRLPDLNREMKELGEERKHLLEARKQPDAVVDKEAARRWNYVNVRLEVLREERTVLMNERDETEHAAA